MMNIIKKLRKSKEIEVYSMLKNYIHIKTNIEEKNIDVEKAERLSRKYNEYWDNFSITFQDISNRKKYTLKCGVLQNK